MRRTKQVSRRPPRVEAANLAGYTTLMNPQNIKPGIDLDAVEQTIMGKTTTSTEELDPQKIYNNELKSLAADLNIDFLDVETESISKPSNPLTDNTIEKLLGDINLSDTESDSESSGSSESSESGSYTGSSYTSGTESGSYTGSSYTESSYTGSSYTESGTESGSYTGSSDHSNVDKALSKLVSSKETKRKSKRMRRVADIDVPSGYERSNIMTEEQERRDHINAVMKEMRNETKTSFGIEHERVQDIKASKLEQIGQLRMTLEEEGVDCSGVGMPNMTSNIEEIDSVLSILKLKNDRNRYSSLAEEVILGFAEGVETVFDGTREVPLTKWKPDYTGYHNTVNVKLHRMRYETSQVVGNVIEKYNINPTVRIFMELLPSFFLYPRQQRKQRGAPGLHSDFGPKVADASNAYASIHKSTIAVENI